MKKIIFPIFIFLLSICVVSAEEIPKIILSDYTFKAQDSWYGSNVDYKNILKVDDNYIYFGSSYYWLDTIYRYDKNDLSKKVKEIDVDLPDDIDDMYYFTEDDCIKVIYITYNDELYLSKIDYATGESTYTKQIETENNITYLDYAFKLNDSIYIKGSRYDSDSRSTKYLLIQTDLEGTIIKETEFNSYFYLYWLQKDYAYIYSYEDNLYHVLDKDGNISKKGYKEDSLPYTGYYFYDESGSYALDENDDDGDINTIKLYKDDKLEKEVDTKTISTVSGGSYYNDFNSEFICTTNYCYLFRSRYGKTFIDVYDRDLNYIERLTKTTSGYINSLKSIYIDDDLLYTIEDQRYSGSSSTNSRVNIYGVERTEKEINVKLADVNLVDIASTFEELGEVEGVTWTVEDESILKLVDGKITPLKVGETKISTEVDGHYYYLIVKVTEDDLKQPETVEENPNTFDSGILSYIIISIISFTAILGSILYEKKHKIKY